MRTIIASAFAVMVAFQSQASPLEGHRHTDAMFSLSDYSEYFRAGAYKTNTPEILTSSRLVMKSYVVSPCEADGEETCLEQLNDAYVLSRNFLNATSEKFSKLELMDDSRSGVWDKDRQLWLDNSDFGGQAFAKSERVWLSDEPTYFIEPSDRLFGSVEDYFNQVYGEIGEDFDAAAFDGLDTFYQCAYTNLPHWEVICADWDTADPNPLYKFYTRLEEGVS